MFLVGLTGGIASGKSTVAKLLTSHGAETIDADQVARDVVKPETLGLQLVVREFGSEILSSSGHLDRQRLGEIIFTDENKRHKLEEILHPLIRTRTAELIAASEKPIVVYAVPLLVEANVDYPFNLIITVEAGVTNQVQRLVRSRGLTVTQAHQRIEIQASRAQRIARADYVLDSSGSLENLAGQVAALWPKILLAAEGRAI